MLKIFSVLNLKSWKIEKRNDGLVNLILVRSSSLLQSREDTIDKNEKVHVSHTCSQAQQALSYNDQVSRTPSTERFPQQTGLSN